MGVWLSSRMKTHKNKNIQKPIQTKITPNQEKEIQALTKWLIPK